MMERSAVFGNIRTKNDWPSSDTSCDTSEFIVIS